MNRREMLLGMSSLALTLPGCAEPYVEPDGPVNPFQTTERDYVLAIAMDTSASFLGEMFGATGRAYRFTMSAIDRFFRDRMEENDHVLLAQLSSSSDALLWEGTPRSMSRRFGSSDALKDFVLEHSDGGGSYLYAGIAQALSYLHNCPGVSDGKTPICVLVLSDMADNSPTRADDKARMTQALGMFKDVPGGIGFYFVNPGLLDEVRNCLIDAGLDPRFIESGILDDPPLPSFAV